MWEETPLLLLHIHRREVRRDPRQVARKTDRLIPVIVLTPR